MNDPRTDQRKANAKPIRLSDALSEARVAYRETKAPPALEAATLAQMRAARERALAGEAKSSTVGVVRSSSWISRTWRSVTSNWWSSALAGSLATVLLATVTSPLWIGYAKESVEVATPFMLVAEPQTAQLDVSQMVRVNVTREAMLDFGIPVPPQRLGEQVRAEMLMGGQGEVLAVRFVESEKQKRWKWQFF
ncbi:MAG: hypothetical protein ACRDAM_18870 [Casimicrobium sp.]